MKSRAGAKKTEDGKNPSATLIDFILCTAENSTIDCEDFENWFVF